MKKVFLCLIIVFITMFTINLNVNAENCSDLSNYECEEGKGVKLGCVYDYTNGVCKSTNATGSSKNKVSCGNVTGIPNKIPRLTSFAIVVLQVAVAVILVIIGIIDLFKGLTSGKEEDIKKGQQTFVKRLITGALVFFIILIVKLFVGAIANSNTSSNVVSCMDCFLSNSCN